MFDRNVSASRTHRAGARSSISLSPLSETPLVTIIVPSYNQGVFIRQTLESILAQDYRPLEVLVIDGASTDGTIDVLQAYDGAPEITWISEPDSGVVEAVNKGFAKANGEVGAIQSSDDYYFPGAVRRGVEALRAQSDLGFVFGDIAKIDVEGRELKRDVLPPYTLEAVLACQTWIPQPSTFFRMDLVRTLGGWREEIPYAPDTDLWLRMAFATDARKVDYCMAARRMHDEQRDRQGQYIIRDYTRMLELLLAEQVMPGRFRRAAMAGCLLQANRYGSGESTGVRLARLWRAILLYPPLHAQVPLGSLIPGWYALRNRIARARHLLPR